MRKVINRLPPVVVGLVVTLTVIAAILVAGWLTGVIGRHAGAFPYHYTRGCGLYGFGECDDQIDGPESWAGFFGYGLVVWIVAACFYACYSALKTLGRFIQGRVRITVGAD
ncbi:hypothetical protein BDI4_660072 [Burkholderia diffusa]|nr:hypothetical protein BDI4_660072 [Burkholderia diffusa]